MGWGGHRANILQFLTTFIVNLPITNHGGTNNFYKRTRNVSCLIGGRITRSYMFGRNFTVVNDRRALVTLLKGNNKKNERFFSRISWWANQKKIVFFVLKCMPVAKIGVVGHISSILWGKRSEIVDVILQFK